MTMYMFKPFLVFSVRNHIIMIVIMKPYIIKEPVA